MIDHNDFEKDLYSKLSVELTKEIDEEILDDILFTSWKEQGYYCVLQPSDIKWNKEEITQWIETHCTRKYFMRTRYCFFESKEEAVQFNLVYGS